MEIKDKIVDYEKYCKSCKYFYLMPNSNGDMPEPCNECLEECSNENSQKPVKYEIND